MHGSLREGLESLLAAKPSNEAAMAAGHLAGCQSCAAEVKAIRAQSELFQTLKAPEELEPGAGFYARVMQRIELRAKRSIWWVFVYSPIGKRLAYGSLSIALALASYVIAAEEFDGHLGTRITVADSSQTDALVSGSPDDQRQAVLASFVAHPLTQDQPSQQ